jgi:hypothetical protein
MKMDAGSGKREEKNEDAGDSGDELDLADKLLQEKLIPSSFTWGEDSKVGSLVAAGLPLPVSHVSSGQDTHAQSPHATSEQLITANTLPNTSWTVIQLRAALIERGLVATGRKDALLQRLLQHSQQQPASSAQHNEHPIPPVAPVKEGEVMQVATPNEKGAGAVVGRRRRRGAVTPGSSIDVRPGTFDLLDEFVSAQVNHGSH